MKSVLKNTLIVLVGVVAGSFVNMTIVNVGPFVIPLPEGADVSTMEGVRESMKLFTPVNFICPLLAHALGTLVGAFVAARLSSDHPFGCAMGVSLFFLAGGIAAVSMIGGPVWFIVSDLVLAYLPMGWLAAILAGEGRLARQNTGPPDTP
ncbi:MAG: hypothetical protein RIK87_27095 [Fuerstiella sp.]